MLDAPEKILLAFGGRDYHDQRRINRELEAEDPKLVIHGDAPGADTCIKIWCEATGVPHRPFPAKWRDITVPGAVVRRRRVGGDLYNVLAGFTRNQEMLDVGKPTHALQFPGGNGTADMAKRCRLAGLIPRVVLNDNT